MSGLRAEIAQREEARLAEEARRQEEHRRQKEAIRHQEEAWRNQEEAWGRREEELARVRKETDQEMVKVIQEGFLKVVAAVWGAELIQFLGTLAILHQDEMKKRMKNSYPARKIKCIPLTASTTFAFSSV